MKKRMEIVRALAGGMSAVLMMSNIAVISFAADAKEDCVAESECAVANQAEEPAQEEAPAEIEAPVAEEVAEEPAFEEVVENPEEPVFEEVVENPEEPVYEVTVDAPAEPGEEQVPVIETTPATEPSFEEIRDVTVENDDEETVEKAAKAIVTSYIRNNEDIDEGTDITFGKTEFTLITDYEKDEAGKYLKDDNGKPIPVYTTVETKYAQFWKDGKNYEKGYDYNFKDGETDVILSDYSIGVEKVEIEPEVPSYYVTADGTKTFVKTDTTHTIDPSGYGWRLELYAIDTADTASIVRREGGEPKDFKEGNVGYTYKAVEGMDDVVKYDELVKYEVADSETDPSKVHEEAGIYEDVVRIYDVTRTEYTVKNVHQEGYYCDNYEEAKNAARWMAEKFIREHQEENVTIEYSVCTSFSFRQGTKFYIDYVITKSDSVTTREGIVISKTLYNATYYPEHVSSKEAVKECRNIINKTDTNIGTIKCV